MPEPEIQQNSKTHTLMRKAPALRKVSRKEGSAEFNHSLPSIRLAKEEKVNVIRNEIDETKNEIDLLKARINALKFEKMRNEKKKSQNNRELQFMQTIRERITSDRKHKQQVQKKREQEREELKAQANALREQLMRDKEQAKSMLQEQKLQAAEQQRLRRKQQENHIKQLMSVELNENREKARRIKQEEESIDEKRKQFYESRVMFAKSNHQERVEKSRSQKSKMERTLNKLRKKQHQLIQDCKESEADLLESLYELESVNPEKKKRRGSIASRVAPVNYDI